MRIEYFLSQDDFQHLGLYLVSRVESLDDVSRKWRRSIFPILVFLIASTGIGFGYLVSYLYPPLLPALPGIVLAICFSCYLYNRLLEGHLRPSDNGTVLGQRTLELTEEGISVEG